MTFHNINLCLNAHQPIIKLRVLFCYLRASPFVTLYLDRRHASSDEVEVMRLALLNASNGIGSVLYYADEIFTIFNSFHYDEPVIPTLILK